MNRKTIAALSSAAFVLASATACASVQKEKIDSMQYLMGTWHCSHTVGSFNGDYTTRYSRVGGAMWMKQEYEFPASLTKPPWQAQAIMGYDERRKAWVRFLALSTGPYFAMRMTDTGDGGWSWKYVSFFPRQTPETPEPDATLAKKSDVEYTIDGPSYKENGTGPLVTEHHVCKKT